MRGLAAYVLAEALKVPNGVPVSRELWRKSASRPPRLQVRSQLATRIGAVCRLTVQ
jgi:hypothetical protein